MKTPLKALLLILCFVHLHAADPFRHIDDSGQLLSSESIWKGDCETKLGEYERATRVKILVQYHLTSPSAEEDKKPGAYMHALARKLGVDQGGVLVVYFNDDPDWRVWIGDGLVNVFTGKPGTVRELTANETIHNTKEAMLAAARTKADAEIAQVQKSSPDGKPPALARRLVIQTDVLLEAIRGKLTAK